MARPSASRFQRLAAVAALLGGGFSSMFASALDLAVSNCEDLAALPTEMTEDTNLLLDGTKFECDEVTTVTVDGRYDYRVTSDSDTVEFTNVRFAILGSADFFFGLGGEESAGSAKFRGVNGLSSDGGALYVENRASAVFSVPITFDSNSVKAPASGGAVYSNGETDFKYDAFFNGNLVKADGDNRGYDGGALCVAAAGAVRFKGLSSFTKNKAEGGGQGGAVANFGSLVFRGVSEYESNIAQEDGDEIGGLGAAIFTELGSITVLKARPQMLNNRAASGGAVYNKGTTILDDGAIFGDNRATGTDRAWGGHVYTSGYVSSAGLITFLKGSAEFGGAVYVDTDGTLSPHGDVIYLENTASEECPDVYVSGQDSECQQITPSSVLSA